jgi:hypothetical protein
MFLAPASIAGVAILSDCAGLGLGNADEWHVDSGGGSAGSLAELLARLR